MIPWDRNGCPVSPTLRPSAASDVEMIPIRFQCYGDFSSWFKGLVSLRFVKGHVQAKQNTICVKQW